MITLEFSGVCKNCQFMDLHAETILINSIDDPHEVLTSVKCSHEGACMRILREYANSADERNETENENDC